MTLYGYKTWNMFLFFKFVVEKLKKKYFRIYRVEFLIFIFKWKYVLVMNRDGGKKSGFFVAIFYFCSYEYLVSE